MTVSERRRGGGVAAVRRAAGFGAPRRALARVPRAPVLDVASRVLVQQSSQIGVSVPETVRDGVASRCQQQRARHSSSAVARQVRNQRGYRFRTFSRPRHRARGEVPRATRRRAMPSATMLASGCREELEELRNIVRKVIAAAAAMRVAIFAIQSDTKTATAIRSSATTSTRTAPLLREKYSTTLLSSARDLRRGLGERDGGIRGVRARRAGGATRATRARRPPRAFNWDLVAADDVAKGVRVSATARRAGTFLDDVIEQVPPMRCGTVQRLLPVATFSSTDRRVHPRGVLPPLLLVLFLVLFLVRWVGKTSGGALDGARRTRSSGRTSARRR